MSEKAEEDFFLPDLCEAQSILFLVLVAELLVFVLVLANSTLTNFSWLDLGLTSLFVQWLVLSSAALLCNARPLLVGFSIAKATVIAYLAILTLTLLFSVAAEWIMLPAGDSWQEQQWGKLGRNLLVAAVMTGIAFRYFYLQYQLRRQEQAELNSRIQALQSRIRPHFLFNSMNIIASLISINPDLAEEVVEDLSVLFRASLNDSSDQPVALSEELSLCEKYVHIESLRLDDRLEVEWNINVDANLVRIPLLTLQPLLENAIYHGIQPLPGGGLVTVEVSQLDQILNIVVRNPVATENFSRVRGNKMALDNIRRRLEAVYGHKAVVKTFTRNETFSTQISYPLDSANQVAQ